MTKFELPWPNADIDIHDDPPNGWDRVVVVGLWTPAHVTRKRYPFAACVGPLRTVRGIDLLVRGLLANPQIRLVVIDGPDLTAGKILFNAFNEHWMKLVNRDDEYAEIGFRVEFHGPDSAPFHDHGEYASALARMPENERNCYIRPPPPPTATQRIPHGDSGDKIVGTTLKDVWPRLLDRIMKCGRTIPTHYGSTVEMLNLVSVITDPEKARAEFKEGINGVEEKELESYAKLLMGSEKAEGAPYSYGSKLAEGGQQGYIEASIKAEPGYRGHFATPWSPATDSRLGAKGTPCLVGIQFRAIEEEDTYTLHATVVFRSHDIFGAYILNLGAICYWLLDLAEKNEMSVGTVTCLSVSAHVYERDFTVAQEEVKRYKHPALRLDSRSTWHVEKISDILLRATALSPDGLEVLAVFEAPSSGALALRIERSGFITEIGNALWLGQELIRVEKEI